MNRKVMFRCSLVSLLLAAPAPLLIALFIHLAGGVLSEALFESLQVGGTAVLYAAVALAVFLLLLLATLSVGAFAPRRGGKVEAVVEDDDRELGEVKWFNVNKGYGFITRDSGEDVFVHFRAIRGRGHRTLAEGQKVRYHVVANDKGLQADDVTVIT
ncbi:cold-shock protein [Halomonas sp. H10-9-1]|uniref:cold-shock protein n=1 Tax=Halomonas sp. H10-9-1 TaxID=2950871 RepID=UPI0032DF52E9